jgi:hypothetical protein
MSFQESLNRFYHGVFVMTAKTLKGNATIEIGTYYTQV